MEDDDIFADPSISKFENSKTDYSGENHYAGMEVLEQIKEKFRTSASNSESVTFDSCSEILEPQKIG